MCEISNRKRAHSPGFSLIEILVYIAILTLISGGSLTLLFSLSDQMAEQRANQLITRTAQLTLERLLADIRGADSVDIFYSTLETTPGVLTLLNGTTTTEFSVASSTVVYEINGGATSVLSDEKVTVEALRFFVYDNTVTQMARAVLTLSAEVGDASVTRTFYAGATLRGSYE